MVGHSVKLSPKNSQEKYLALSIVARSKPMAAEQSAINFKAVINRDPICP